MASVTAAVISSYYLALSQEAAHALAKDGLRNRKLNRAELDFYDQVRQHRSKMEKENAWTLRQAKIGTWILITLALSIVACIADWTGVF